MPNVSIREKWDWGFFGHSTINHDYNLKAVSGDVVVVDNATGLMWHQSGSDDEMGWDDAKKWVKDLNSEEAYAGYNDWRLPTLEEAVSLLESNWDDSYIDHVFSKEQKWEIWTGDGYKYEYEGGSETAWSVEFCYGYVRGFNPGYSNNVRPVRSVR